jgi:hypothetical protein
VASILSGGGARVRERGRRRGWNEDEMMRGMSGCFNLF